MYVSGVAQEVIDKAKAFHGHWCGGLALGIRAAVWAMEHFLSHNSCGRSFGADAAFMHDGGLIAEPEYVVRVVATNENGHALRGYFPEHVPHGYQQASKVLRMHVHYPVWGRTLYQYQLHTSN